MEEIFIQIFYAISVFLGGLIFFYCTFYPTIWFFNRKEYRLPKFSSLFLFSLMGFVIFYFLFSILGSMYNTFPYRFLSENQARIDVFELGLVLGFFASIIFPLFRLEEGKKPRHDQKQFVELDENLSLAEIEKVISKKFPDTDLSYIGISSGFPDKQDVLRFLPYDFSQFIEHDDNFATKIYYPCSLGIATEIAKIKDPEMKKTKIYFFNGEPCLSIKK